MSPYGDGTEKFVNGAKNVAFSPPYGDGTTFTEQQGDLFSFSPPYGDGTYFVSRDWVAYKFSPPYGDGTGSLQCSIRKEKVFAPLRGWYTKYITEDRKMEELNA